MAVTGGGDVTERQEHDRIGLRTDELLTHRRRDADDLEPGRLATADANARTDRLLSSQKHPHESLVDDRRFGARPSVIAR